MGNNMAKNYTDILSSENTTGRYKNVADLKKEELPNIGSLVYNWMKVYPFFTCLCFGYILDFFQ